MDFVDFLVDVSHNVEKISGQRDGQYAFNRLHVEKPELAAFVAGGLMLDPFYDDKKLKRFFRFLHIVWDEPAEDYKKYYSMFAFDEGE